MNRNTPEAITVLGNDDTVKCWGKSDKGQLGLGNTTNHNVPTTVTALGTDAVALVLGYAHTCAQFNDGFLKCWGDND